MKSTLFMLLASASFLPFLSASDNTAGWKTDADGHLVLKDGNPIYVNTGGQEQTVESTTITRLNGEAQSHREAKAAAEEKLKAFTGIDPVKAKEAIEAVKNIDTKKLIDSGEVDKVKKEISDQYTAQLTEKDNALKSANGKIDNMLISGVFNDSEFVRDGIAVPKDMFEATFRNNFKVEDGKVIAYGKDGNKLYSKERAGEYATPEEALRIMVEGHSQKDVIMKANPGNGSGNEGGGGNRGGGRSIKRSEFEKLPATQQAEYSTKVAAGSAAIVD